MIAVRPRRFLVPSLLLMSFLTSDLVGQSEVPTQAFLDQFQIVREWWGTSSIDASQDRVKYLTLGKKNLYVQSELGSLTAFDALTGKRKWVAQVGPTTGSNTRLVEIQIPKKPTDGSKSPPDEKQKEELLLVSSGMSLYAIQENDGNLRWRASLGFATSASPAGSGKMLYFPTNSGTLYAIDVNKLNDLHASGKLAREAPLAVKWKFITSNPINISPICTDLYVNFVGADGTVYSVAAENHELRFRFSAGSPLAAPLVVAQDSTLVTAENFHLYNINQATGQVRWEFVTGPRIRTKPTVVAGSVYIAPEHGSLFCITLKGGKKVWESESATGFISANDKRIYAYDRLGNLVLLSNETGELVHRVGLQHFTHRIPNELTDRAYIATDSGLVIALRDADLAEPVLHPPLLPESESEPQSTPAATPPSEKPEEDKPTDENPAETPPAESNPVPQ